MDCISGPHFSVVKNTLTYNILPKLLKTAHMHTPLKMKQVHKKVPTTGAAWVTINSLLKKHKQRVQCYLTGWLVLLPLSEVTDVVPHQYWPMMMGSGSCNVKGNISPAPQGTIDYNQLYWMSVLFLFTWSQHWSTVYVNLWPRYCNTCLSLVDCNLRT